ncbi:amino acid permease [Streptomyces angustmyceticus]
MLRCRAPAAACGTGPSGPGGRRWLSRHGRRWPQGGEARVRWRRWRKHARGPYPAERLVLPVGLAAGQPEGRLRIRVADVLLPGDRGRGGRQRAGEPGPDAAGRSPVGRGHGAPDHARGAARPDPAGRGLDALTVAIDDLPRISASGSPVAAIMRDRFGPAMERTLLVGVSFAFFGAGMVVMTACSRIVFAMSRDARFPAHRLMRRVSPRTRTPVPATVLILLVGVVLMVALPGAALLKLITASTILPAIIYGATVTLYLAVRRRLARRKGAFDLGRFELPVAVCALVWSVLSLFVLVAPPEALVPVLIVVGLLLAGGVFFLCLLRFDREALETEPGDLDVFQH